MIQEGQWAYSFNGEEFDGNYDNKEEAIEEAKDYLEDDQLIIYVGQIEEFPISADIDLLLERLGESAYEQCGDFAEEYLHDVTDEHFKELEKNINSVLNTWISKYYKPNFYTIGNVERIKI